MKTLNIEFYGVEQIDLVESIKVNGGGSLAYEIGYAIGSLWDAFTKPIRGAYEAGYDAGRANS
jgi:hypothetical protein